MSIEPHHDFISQFLGKPPASLGQGTSIKAPAEDVVDSGLARIHTKWGDAAVAGFQAVPDLLFKHQKTLGITATEMVVLLNVLMHWWYATKKPFPRPTTIATRMGIAVRTVQRAISRLEEIGLLKRVKTEEGTTILDPDPLVDKLSVFAKTDRDFLARRAQKAA
ncbi:helix-turn-helix domain-containing protein [Aureimonas phyllosphaerae]|uniref:DNA replication protein DnaD n=1 Tax=Aureimonas phyllosphaerae TaxID=1166078 RepID=A0A7W6BXX4_9HYPH|nr:helix-turn-helix domain-containing protein [Aureimonas phyllosphaerae]MBB3938109.1 DNA replication protein DnaD [Aureimonas phyllosphaerae]MBB3962116.1 DNA replication protein DnaD [Aureimonas phyllosphaerae]SFF55885.1 Helix-turn-helix domain-containing protein [Aureimonas phyllosphaerae]